MESLDPTMVDRRPNLLRAIVVGAVAGALSGLFGVGGGILIVPALVLFLGFGQRLAHGTSLTAIIPIAISGVVGYAISGEVDWVVAGFLAAGAVIGVPLGTAALRRLPATILRISFAGLLFVTAVRVALATSAAAGRADLDLLLGGSLSLTGLLSGALAGLMGVGGGVIMVPAQLVLFSIPDAIAKGTSLAVILPIAVVGTWRNARHGTTDLRTGGVVGVAGTLSAFGMAQVSVNLDPELSGALFAVLLVATAVRILYQSWRDRSTSAPDPPQRSSSGSQLQ